MQTMFTHTTRVAGRLRKIGSESTQTLYEKMCVREAGRLAVLDVSIIDAKGTLELATLCDEEDTPECLLWLAASATVVTRMGMLTAVGTFAAMSGCNGSTRTAKF